MLLWPLPAHTSAEFRRPFPKTTGIADGLQPAERDFNTIKKASSGNSYFDDRSAAVSVGPAAATALANAAFDRATPWPQLRCCGWCFAHTRAPRKRGRRTGPGGFSGLMKCPQTCNSILWARPIILNVSTATTAPGCPVARMKARAAACKPSSATIAANCLMSLPAFGNVSSPSSHVGP